MARRGGGDIHPHRPLLRVVPGARALAFGWLVWCRLIPVPPSNPLWPAVLTQQHGVLCLLIPTQQHNNNTTYAHTALRVTPTPPYMAMVPRPRPCSYGMEITPAPQRGRCSPCNGQGLLAACHRPQEVPHAGKAGGSPRGLLPTPAGPSGCPLALRWHQRYGESHQPSLCVWNKLRGDTFIEVRVQAGRLMLRPPT